MSLRTKHRLSLIAAVGILWVILGVLTWVSVHRNDGRLIYALDDAYIHMAVSRNLALHGTWGIHKDTFASCSSSPLWSSLVALSYLATGPNTWAPLVLNVLLATAVLVSAHAILKRFGAGPKESLLVLAAVMLLTPLPTPVLSGMEHALHTVLALGFVYLAAQCLSDGPKLQTRGRSGLVGLLALAPLLVMSRYEGAAMILFVCLLLTARGRPAAGVALGAAAAVPVLAFGAMSRFRGWQWLPSSVLLKRTTIRQTNLSQELLDLLGGNAYRAIGENPHVFVMLCIGVIALIVQWRAGRDPWRAPIVMTVIFLFTMLAQMQFANAPSFYRREAYLMCLGIVAAAVSLREWIRQDLRRLFASTGLIGKIGLVAAGVLLVAPVCIRGGQALKQTPHATTNIYQQQIQMSRFLRKHYEDRPIAANDIGAISYFADVRCLNQVGLANLTVARLRLSGRFDTAAIDRLTRTGKTEIAIVYDSWFSQSESLPSRWKRVRRWRISDNVVCASDTVSFYAPDPARAEALAAQLDAFERELPPAVESLPGDSGE